ncbi:hypothetical protein SAMN05428985_103541 [Nocardioides sp. YR527]|uniref:hypothetical protein n=1 Tax=Nocardioides sp. YR527 TaxID=1881028 RepID=UPI00087E02CB|nr:hypothetical protein [Nocardioides sp. YR527]SDK31532.1 hypothetical protein SAMN05428985_103541 [Nocardioides sp. YR527]
MKKLPVIGAAAASLILITPAAAQAAPPYDVAVGGINIYTPLVAANCHSISGTGQAHSGTAMSGNYTGSTPADHPFTIEDGAWTGCTEQFGTPLDFTVVGEWRFTTEDAAVTTPTTDLVAGTVDNIHLNVLDSAGTGLCDFSITGAAAATFDETTRRLAIRETTLDGSLFIEDVTGNCLGMFANGDPVDLYFSYAFNIPDGPLNIS